MWKMLPAPSTVMTSTQEVCMASEICYICPTYGHYGYARTALRSFFKNTPGGLGIVVGDGHPGFHRFWDAEWNVMACQFSDHVGLTRSWNYGLRVAREVGAKYAICSNDDILFTPGWEVGPVALLEDDAIGVVGALSNGPGWTNDKQNIWDHIRAYRATDCEQGTSEVASTLATRYSVRDHLKVHAVNGFFMISHTARWWEGRFDDEHVFNPGSRYAMTQNEDELQNRFQANGWHSVVSLRSFIFHYRSVTRGDNYRQGMWCRRQVEAAV